MRSWLAKRALEKGGNADTVKPFARPRPRRTTVVAALLVAAVLALPGVTQGQSRGVITEDGRGERSTGGTAGAPPSAPLDNLHNATEMSQCEAIRERIHDESERALDPVNRCAHNCGNRRCAVFTGAGYIQCNYEELLGNGQYLDCLPALARHCELRMRAKKAWDDCSAAVARHNRETVQAGAEPGFGRPPASEAVPPAGNAAWGSSFDEWVESLAATYPELAAALRSSDPEMQPYIAMVRKAWEGGALDGGLTPDLMSMLREANERSTTPPPDASVPWTGHRVPVPRSEESPRPAQPSPTPVGADDCAELRRFAELELEPMWQAQQAKAGIAREGRETAEKLRDQLQDDAWWALSSGPQVAQAIKTGCDAIEGVLAAVSPSGKVVELAKRAMASSAEWALRAYDLLKAGRKVHGAFTKSSDELLLGFVLGEAGQVGATLKLLSTTAANLENGQRLAQEQAQAKQEVREQVERLERQMRQYEAQVRIAVRAREIVEGYRLAIDRYCSEPPQPVILMP